MGIKFHLKEKEIQPDGNCQFCVLAEEVVVLVMVLSKTFRSVLDRITMSHKSKKKPRQHTEVDPRATNYLHL
jgi:hypothetical protein